MSVTKWSRSDALLDHSRFYTVVKHRLDGLQSSWHPISPISRLKRYSCGVCQWAALIISGNFLSAHTPRGWLSDDISNKACLPQEPIWATTTAISPLIFVWVLWVLGPKNVGRSNWVLSGCCDVLALLISELGAFNCSRRILQGNHGKTRLQKYTTSKKFYYHQTKFNSQTLKIGDGEPAQIPVSGHFFVRTNFRPLNFFEKLFHWLSLRLG